MKTKKQVQDELNRLENSLAFMSMAGRGYMKALRWVLE